jgi:hypothetical protein
MWFASALLSGDQTVVSTSYGSTRPWQSAFVTLSITFPSVLKASFWAFTVLFFGCSYGPTDSRTDCHAQRVDCCPK